MRCIMAGVIVFTLAVFARGAAAETRLALIIANKDYPGGATPALHLPFQDAEVMAEALTAVGFGKPNIVRNANKQQMETAVAEFATALKQAGPDTVGFFY